MRTTEIWTVFKFKRSAGIAYQWCHTMQLGMRNNTCKRHLTLQMQRPDNLEYRLAIALLSRKLKLDILRKVSTDGLAG